MRTRTVVIVAVLAGLLGVVTALQLERTGGPTGLEPATGDGPAVPAVGVGDPVPALRLAAPDGTRHALADFARGRPLLVNFWASWCGPCIREMPALDAFAAQQGANGVQVVGIAIDDTAAVRSFLRDRPVRYPVLVDAPGADDASVRLGDVRGVLPFSVLVGADGRILRQHAGPLDLPDLQAWAAEAARTRN